MLYRGQTFEQLEAAARIANETGEGFDKIRTLQQASKSKSFFVKHHINKHKDCTDCRLGQCVFVTNRVFYRGYIPCEVLFVGEAPNRNEDAQALPYIADAGTVVDDIIKDSATRFRGKDNSVRWCITNAIMCIPWDFGNIRSPQSDEIQACSDKLTNLIRLAEPRVIVDMGVHAKSAVNKIKDLAVRRVSIPKPEWMLSQKGECALHVKKAVLQLVSVFNEELE